MKKYRVRDAFFPYGLILFALAATPTFFVSSLKAYPLLAQSAAPELSVPTAVPSGTTVKIDGSSSMAATNQSFKQRFETQFPGTKVEIGYEGTDQALKSVLEGKSDLAAIGRPLTDAEKAQGLTVAPVSRKKIAILVGADNPFNGSLTVEQFAKIFRGEIKDWSEVGGAAGAIRMVDRPETSDTRQAFLNYPIFQPAPLQLGANATQLSEDSTEAVIKELGKDGIGYAIVDQATAQPGARIVPMHDTLPTDPRYPFSQPLAYAYKAGLNPGASAFLGLAIVRGQPQPTANAQVASPVPPSPVPPSPEATVSPAAVSPSPTVAISPAAVSPSPTAAIETNGASSNLGWLWLLALPLLGGLLWWLMRDRTPEPIVPVAPVPAPRPIPDSRIILSARDCKNAYAYWEVPDETKNDLRRQERQLKLRLYDVTDSPNNYQTTQIQQLNGREHEQDLHIAIPRDDRDYLVELGYLTEDNRWTKLAHSAPIRVPACPIPESIQTERQLYPVVDAGAFVQRKAAAVPGVIATTAAAAVATTAAAAAAGTLAVDRAVGQRPYGWTQPDHKKSQIILVPRTSKSAYAYWEISQADKDAARQQGAEKMALRIYEVTNLDMDKVSAHSMQQFECDERDCDRHVPIPVTDRDYVAEVGYITGDGRWLSTARSQHVWVPVA